MIAQHAVGDNVKADEISVEKNTTDAMDEDILKSSSDDIISRNRLLENDIRIMKSEIIRLQHEASSMKERLQDNLEKIKLNKQLPYLVSNIVEVLNINPEEEEPEEGANVDLDFSRKGKCAIVKTSTRTVNSCNYCSIFIRLRFFRS